MSSVISLIAEIERSLLSIYNDPLVCNQYAWWLLEKVTGRTKATLLTSTTFVLDDDQQKRLAQLLDQLIIEQMPIQYVLGSVPFNDLDIIVKPPILIPRPETEEWSFNLAQQLRATQHSNLTILDLCCGSGCIALMLAHALPQATVYATDISSTAVALTEENARHNGIATVTVLQSDLFAALPKNRTFDLIVSNPPYIAPEEWDSLDVSVTAWEDRQALIADDHGMALLKKIIDQSLAYLQSNSVLAHYNVPQLVLEIGYTQGPAIAQYMEQAGFTKVTILKDLEGKDRVVCGSVDNVAAPHRSP